MDDDNSNQSDDVDIDLDPSSPNESQDNDEFEHPEDVPTTDANEVPEVNSAEDVVSGDTARMNRLEQKAEEMKDKNNTKATTQNAAETSGTPVKVPEESETEAETGSKPEPEPDETAGEDDTIGQASDSIFTDEEADDIDDEMGGFEIEPVESIPEDFDYNEQDTSHFGAEFNEVVIEHNGVYFKLEQPRGNKEDQFWSLIQKQDNLAGMFTMMIRFTVVKPNNIEERMEAENWTGFAKAGLAMKCSSFLGLDALQDF